MESGRERHQRIMKRIIEGPRRRPRPRPEPPQDDGPRFDLEPTEEGIRRAEAWQRQEEARRRRARAALIAEQAISQNNDTEERS